jgi:serine/threonine protein kinase
VGVITSTRLTGFLPFYDKNHSVLFEKIQSVDYNWDDCPEVSPAAKHFIQHLLVKDPKKRYTAESAINHPWVKVRGQAFRWVTSPRARGSAGFPSDPPSWTS